MSFAGLRVLSLESRRAKEIEGMIRRLEGDAFVAPRYRNARSKIMAKRSGSWSAWRPDEFDLVICMTGAGLAFLRDVIRHAHASRALGCGPAARRHRVARTETGAFVARDERSGAGRGSGAEHLEGNRGGGGREAGAANRGRRSTAGRTWK